MFKSLSTRLLLAVILLVTVVSCKKDSLPLTLANLKSGLGSGTFRVTTFLVGTSDNSYVFSGYAFQFNPNQQLVITSTINSYNGTWSCTANGASIYLTMNVGSLSNLSTLNRTWQVTDIFASSINFQDLTGGVNNSILGTFSK